MIAKRVINDVLDVSVTPSGGGGRLIFGARWCDATISVAAETNAGYSHAEPQSLSEPVDLIASLRRGYATLYTSVLCKLACLGTPGDLRD